jgi:hypothetical protein
MNLHKTVEDLETDWKNPYAQWYAAGMPAFVTKNLEPWKQISIKFPTMEDRKKFAEITGYSLTEKTNVIWYPDKGRERNNMNRVIEDE